MDAIVSSDERASTCRSTPRGDSIELGGASVCRAPAAPDGVAPPSGEAVAPSAADGPSDAAAELRHERNM